ncbi:hypothetical protein [uncultured Sulfitobacter sp.]|uniref:hypothetical protein n=1 Tax=uncultured Sulfitobacter sp. TaxID=191468 RepID=UPI002602FFA9|nr:hypothetical protein [uncultured Sulfitobacter sp.]
MMDRAIFEAIVAEAMLAPSAHNTQPVRWAQSGEGVTVYADTSRRLPVGDPNDRDFQIACGAAVEATVLSFSARGFGADVTWLDSIDKGELRPVASVTPKGAARPDDVALAQYVKNRITHRTGFSVSPDDVWSGWHDNNVTLIQKSDQIKWLATRIDHASAAIMRDQNFRTELLHWMRMKPTSAGYHSDGLNNEALVMDRLSAVLAPSVLGTKLYDLLAWLGLGPALSGEAARTSGAGAIALFHWPVDGSMYEAGRAFYRYWLAATTRGLVGWPAAALADHPATCATVCQRFGISKERMLLNALRLGAAKGETPNRTRLNVSDVIIEIDTPRG